MTFLNAYLLGGLVLLGVPVVVHLLMRQKPRRLPFPAFRFLRQRHLINRRRMRLQHLLLLLLRMLVLAALCLAIAQPKLFLPQAAAAWLGLDSPRPAAAAFVFDVSHSMEYRVGGLSRLDDARQRSLDLLHDLPPDSQTAVLDTGEDGSGDEADEDWIATPAQLRARINGLRLRPVRTSLVRQIEKAADLLAKAGQGGAPSSRMLYVFSDRTATSWDAVEARRVKLPDGVQTAYIDLGVDQSRDLSIDKVEVKPPVAAPGDPVAVHVEVRALGGDFDANLVCQLDNEAGAVSQRVTSGAASRKPVAYDFKLKAPAPLRPPGAAEGVFTEPHQIVVKFTTPDDRPFKDDLPHDNARYATFLVRDDPRRQGRQVLTLADDPQATRYWNAALMAYEKVHPDEGFHDDVRPAADAAKIHLKELEAYRAVCLFQTAQPLPDDFWKDLEKYVGEGGGLAVVPPVSDLTAAEIARWNAAAESHHLLPARLRQLVAAPEGQHVYWDDFKANNPLTRPFYDWKRGANPDFADEALRPFVNRYWEVDPLVGESAVLSTYADAGQSPALVERKQTVEASVGEGDTPGRVLLFTTTLDRRQIAPNRDWHNFYTDSSFGLVLVNEVCKYLAGDSSTESRNFVCGAPVVLPLPKGSPRGVYRLDAPDPDLTESERSITVGDKDASLEIRAASAPGQYTVFDPGRNRFTAFSINVSPEECRLDRLPAQDIETTLGPGSVLTPEPGANLNDLLRGRTRGASTEQRPAAPVDLLPLLMMLTLLFLTFEGLLANKFYQRSPSAASGDAERERTP